LDLLVSAGLDDRTSSHGSARLLAALAALAAASPGMRRATAVDLPDPGKLELEPAMVPRDAFSPRRKR
jgi:hypothetical protein